MPEKAEKTKKVNPHAGHRDRMKKRYIQQTFRSFEPHELIEMLLYYGVPQKDTNPLAHELLNTFGSVTKVLTADRELLLSVPGVTPHIATLLNLAGDLHRFCSEEVQPLGKTLRRTEDFVKFLAPRFEGLSAEEVWIVSMDLLSKVVGVHQLSKGSPLSSDINMRKVLQFAIADNAIKLIIAHNHPSGIALPSQPDLSATVSLAKALKAAGVQLVDHLIYAKDNDCISFRDSAELAPLLDGRPQAAAC